MTVLTSDVVARIVQAEKDSRLACLKSIRKIPGDPLEVETREFGHVLATLARRRPERWWNRVSGLTAGDENLLDEILAWYREREVQPGFEIVPPQSSESLLRALATCGFSQSGFMSVMYGAPDENQPSPADGIVVREQDDREFFLGVATETGFILGDDNEFWRKVARAEFAEWRCYVAFLNGVPAAHGAMFIHDRTASFRFGATIEKYRGRGCQSALLRARIRDAARSRCDLITVQASPGSGSQRNIERAGMRVAYTKALWTPLE